MPKQTHLLDDIQIKHWIARGESVAKSDGDGLTFTLSESGTATWVLRYRVGGGKRRELTLGNYPDLTLAGARKEARAHRAAIDSGRDPAQEKKRAKAVHASDWTVTQLVADFKEKVLPNRAHNTVLSRTAHLDNDVITTLGSLTVSKVSPSDIVYMLAKRKLTWTMSNRLFYTTKVLFDHALGKRMIDFNPCAGISLRAIKGDPPPVRPRVMLSEKELRSLLPEIDTTLGRANGLAFRLLLTTCVRSSELAQARWADVDFEATVWRVQKENEKMRRGFFVPLTPTMVGWFRELRAIAGDSAYILPARAPRRLRNGDTHVGKSTLAASISRAFERGGIETRRFTPHDTRSTAKGHMRNFGVSWEASEMALNHKLRSLDAIYDVRDEIPEKRAAIEVWATFIESCTTGAKWNVTPLRAA